MMTGLGIKDRYTFFKVILRSPGGQLCDHLEINTAIINDPPEDSPQKPPSESSSGIEQQGLLC